MANDNDKKDSGKSNKEKAQKFLNKIIADGKITEEEAERAIKRGIDRARIEKAQTKSFKQGNPFTRTPALTQRDLASNYFTNPDVREMLRTRPGQGQRPTLEQINRNIRQNLRDSAAPLIFKKGATDALEDYDFQQVIERNSDLLQTIPTETDDGDGNVGDDGGDTTPTEPTETTPVEAVSKGTTMSPTAVTGLAQISTNVPSSAATGTSSFKRKNSSTGVKGKTTVNTK